MLIAVGAASALPRSASWAATCRSAMPRYAQASASSSEAGCGGVTSWKVMRPGSPGGNRRARLFPRRCRYRDRMTRTSRHHATASALVRRLDLEDAARLLSGASFWTTAEAPGVPTVQLADGPHGVRLLDPDVGDVVGAVPAPRFPPAVALASTVDVDLVERVGHAPGEEARLRDADVLPGPGAHIKRSPLCGRNFEYVGAALVRGIQRTGVGACVKHFAANNQETERLRVSADVDERTLREIYLRPFQRVVTTARPATLMTSYNRVNGTYVGEDPRLVTGVLRDEWGFDGLVLSDWGAVHDRLAG